MAQPEKKLMRGSRVLGGVCSGIATYFNVDVILVRVAAVILACCSAGIIIIPYVALWMLLPAEKPDQDSMRAVEVNPASIQSDIYGRVVDSRQDDTPPPTIPFAVNAGAGHIPPKPPVGAEGYTQTYGGTPYVSPGTGPVYGGPGAAGPTFNSPAASGPLPPPPTPLPRESKKKESPMFLVVGVLTLLLIVLFTLYARLFAGMVPGSQYTQFFPILFAVVGVVLLVVPFKKRSLAVRLCSFLLCVEAAFLLLPFSLGLVPFQVIWWMSIETWLFWVLFLAMFVVALVLRKEPLLLAAVAIFFIAILITFDDVGVFDRLELLFELHGPHKVPYPGVYWLD